ncbi:MAG TPA: hypothetical protein VFV71_07315 [Burkholderiales bacterium]|nr:hypothetical protein [Burkholderiales bacterium]
MKPQFVLVAGLLAALAATPACAAGTGGAKGRMYKCIDGKGKVYYSDKMNPDCGNGTELNRQGVAMPAREKSQPKPAAGAAAQSPPMAKTDRDKERRDRALMATYTTEEEIDAARDRSLAIPEQGVKIAETKLGKASQRLTALKKEADTLAAQKKTLPPHLLEDVAASQKDVAGLEADIAQRKAQSEAIRARFAADKQRFRELKGTARAASAGSK